MVNCTFAVRVTELGVSTSAGLPPARRKGNKNLRQPHQWGKCLITQKDSPTSLVSFHTPASRISAWTGPAGPEAAHVLRVAHLRVKAARAILQNWKQRRWNQKCVSGCSLFTSHSHASRGRLYLHLASISSSKNIKQNKKKQKTNCLQADRLTRSF